jgi:hypothetical protein
MVATHRILTHVDEYLRLGNGPVAECMEAYMDRSRKLATLGEVRQYQSSSWKLEKLGLEPGELAMGHCRMSALG